jgi:hypothetical protein
MLLYIRFFFLTWEYPTSRSWLGHRRTRKGTNPAETDRRLARASVVEDIRVVGVCKGEVTVARACINEEQGERASIFHACIDRWWKDWDSTGREYGGAALHLTQHAQRSRWMDHGWADGRRRKAVPKLGGKKKR